MGGLRPERISRRGLPRKDSARVEVAGALRRVVECEDYVDVVECTVVGVAGERAVIERAVTAGVALEGVGDQVLQGVGDEALALRGVGIVVAPSVEAAAVAVAGAE